MFSCKKVAVKPTLNMVSKIFIKKKYIFIPIIHIVIVKPNHTTMLQSLEFACFNLVGQGNKFKTSCKAVDFSQSYNQLSMLLGF